jgi:hypothetical protein
MTNHKKWASLLATVWLLSAFVGCVPAARTPAPQATATPILQPVSLRIAYTSDCWGNTDPVPAVDCG